MSELSRDINDRKAPVVGPSRKVALPWLFSATVDLWTFLGSAALALGLLLLGSWRGWLEHDSPEWLWIASVVLIDVAHVYATGFRVYFDGTELRRRPWLYLLVPVLAFVIGAAVYSEGRLLFWRALAYLAVFHFVRQQYGWVALYRSKAGDHDPTGRVIDTTAIYLATIYPLVYWHSHPRRFSWFVMTDFAQLPVIAERILAPAYWTALSLYALRSIHLAIGRQQYNPGKDIVVLTTAVCWYVGIVSFNSDYAFTVTNVITHGVPYMVLVYWHRQHRPNVAFPAGHFPPGRWSRLLSFVGVLWLLAYAEELFWDCGVWHERSWLFGPAWDIGDFDQILVPLLAVPQITHYILDGFIWRRRSNPEFGEQYGPAKCDSAVRTL
jgi:hypothetical protein